MAKDTINVEGKDVVVREDTARAYRGVSWAWVSIGAFILILAILFVVFFFGSARNRSFQPPVKSGAASDSR